MEIMYVGQDVRPFRPTRWIPPQFISPIGNMTMTLLFYSWTTAGNEELFSFSPPYSQFNIEWKNFLFKWMMDRTESESRISSFPQHGRKKERKRSRSACWNRPLTTYKYSTVDLRPRNLDLTYCHSFDFTFVFEKYSWYLMFSNE